MRVMLYFVAFGFLFAFVIPLLIGTLVQDEGQVARQLRQGADPAVILEQTAAGMTDKHCPINGYRYLITGDGHPYVQMQNNPYIAVLIEDRVEILKIDIDQNLAIPLGKTEQLSADMNRLSTILSACIQSDKKPQITQLLIPSKN